MMWYQHRVLRGIHAAAVVHDCNILIACGMDEMLLPRTNMPAWPMLSSTTSFVPVSPWNTDGLIVVGMYLTDEQNEYLRAITERGHPVVYAGFEGPGPSVSIDNAGGIRQALEHLRAHGHQRIAFISGGLPAVGESRPRLDAYDTMTRAMGLDTDPRLVAHGDLSIEGGERAMHQILASDVSFTALVANNDSSAFGAAAVLRAHGLRIPDDVAIVGFDNLLETWTHAPPLTTVHNPAFAVGQRALRTMLDLVGGQRPVAFRQHMPVRLVVRRSCGCDLGLDRVSVTAVRPPLARTHITPARAMAEAVLVEAVLDVDEAEALCDGLITSFVASVRTEDGAPFEHTLLDVLQRVEAVDDDVNAWQGALALLGQALAERHPPHSAATRAWAEALLNRARQMINERTRQQAMSALLRKNDLTTALGQMTSQLLVTLDASHIPSILAEHLPELRIAHVCGALFAPDVDDPVAQSEMIVTYGLEAVAGHTRFLTRQFPPDGLYPPDRAVHLALLPLVVQEVGRGFIALDAANFEPCAAIVRNIAATLRASHLYAEALHGRQQAEEANRLKSRFLSMVSHELRTPLNLIVGLSELLLRQRPAPELHDTIIGDLERIYTSAQHLGQLIGDVLDLASSEAGQLHLVREPLDLADVLRVVAITGEYMAREKGLAWRAYLPATGAWVVGDRTRLRQVVPNLVSNAVKFTPTGTVTLVVAPGPGNVAVTVSDTGLGVPLAEQTRIFDEFQRAERTTARGYGGLGLGLAICKQLVELHGGTISMRSSGEDDGATFCFTLPAMAEQAATREPAFRAPSERLIVLLTGHAQNHHALHTYLAQRGLSADVCHVDVHADWFSGLVAAPPAVILLDAELALEQGWHLFGVLQRHPATERIPLVVCTLDEHQQHGVLFELKHQRKPLDAEHLAQLLFAQGLSPNDTSDAQTVLVVDDDLGMLELHSRLLHEYAPTYRVLQARNGREALATMQETRPALVLLDLMMPELDGFGVLEAMRASEATRAVPVIVLTAQTLSEAEMERLNHGVAAILSKGVFNAEEIFRHIDATLRRTQRLGDATQRLVRKAMLFIHAHFAEPLARPNIAHHVGITEDYLTDCFHQALGIPPITYLHRYRIKQARALLETGRLSVTEVALAVGFNDGTYFGRVFQREVGITPSAYRRGQRAP